MWTFKYFTELLSPAIFLILGQNETPYRRDKSLKDSIRRVEEILLNHCNGKSKLRERENI